MRLVSRNGRDHTRTTSAGAPYRNLVRSGVSQQVAQSISGHKTASVFARYNIVSTDDCREAMQRVAGLLHRRGVALFARHGSGHKFRKSYANLRISQMVPPIVEGLDGPLQI